MKKALVSYVLLICMHAQASIPIIGGSAVSAEDAIAHSTAALVEVNSQGEALCTVSIVRSDLAVTAGHCVRGANADNPAVFAIIFSADIHKPASPIRRVDHIEIPSKRADDIALLHFTGGLPSGYVPAILLPFDHPFHRGEAVELAGYGINQAVPASGEGILRKTEVNVLLPDYSETEIEFDQSHGGGACHGDSGGPAYAVIDGHPYLFGITSRGGGDCDQTVIYSKISAFADWFQDATHVLTP